MDKGKLFTYFNFLFKLTPSTNGWYRFTNPFDIKSIEKSDISMGVHFEYNVVHSFRQNYKTSIVKFLMDYTSLSYKELIKIIDSNKASKYRVSVKRNNNKVLISLPEGFYYLDEKQNLQKRALQYLQNRRFNMKLIKYYNIGYCNKGKFFGRIIFPFIINNKLEYFIGRSFLNQEPKYLNPSSYEVNFNKGELFFNQQALKIFRTIYLTEGAFDAISVGKNAIASLGWSLTNTQKSILIDSNIKTLKIIPDKGFYHKSLLLALELSKHINIEITNLDNIPENFNDVDDYGINNLTFKPFNITML